jgi:hypothetical protein
MVSQVLELAETVTNRKVPTVKPHAGSYPIQDFMFITTIDHPLHIVGRSVCVDLLACAFATKEMQTLLMNTLLRLISESQAGSGFYQSFHSYDTRIIFSKVLPIRDKLKLPLAFESFVGICHVVFIQVYSQDWSARNKALFRVACFLFRPLQLLLNKQTHPHKTSTAKRGGEESKDQAESTSLQSHMISEWPVMQQELSSLFGREVPLVHFCEGSIDHFLGMFKAMLKKTSGNRGAMELEIAYCHMQQQAAAYLHGLVKKKSHLKKTKK